MTYPSWSNQSTILDKRWQSGLVTAFTFQKSVQERKLPSNLETTRHGEPFHVSILQHVSNFLTNVLMFDRVNLICMLLDWYCITHIHVMYSSGCSLWSIWKSLGKLLQYTFIEVGIHVQNSLPKVIKLLCLCVDRKNHVFNFHCTSSQTNIFHDKFLQTTVHVSNISHSTGSNDHYLCLFMLTQFQLGRHISS